jgi:hypothetical protein
MLLLGGCDSYQNITFVNHTIYQVKADVRIVDLDYSGYIGSYSN